MEGPTPVSALIHAATMVTAGVFLIIRCSILFENSLTLLNFVTIIGSLTAFLAASSAVFQNDIKKLVAYSTISQIGYLVCGCGFCCYEEVLLYLIIHALNKAFLSTDFIWFLPYSSAPLLIRRLTTSIWPFSRAMSSDV